MSSRNMRNNQERKETLSSGEPSQREGPSESIHPLIDLEENEDDVIEISPRAFFEGMANTRRTRARIGYDFNMENRTIPIDAIYIDLQGSPSEAVENVMMSSETNKEAQEPQNQTPELPNVHTYKCPICMGPFEEEMATRCGHIFCKKCIKTALSANRVCPKCGKKATPRGLLRVFFPCSK